MRNKVERILAIDPGTRFMGIALLENTKLIYHGVKVFQGATTPQKALQEATAAVSQLIGDYKPHVVALEHTYFAGNMRAEPLNRLFGKMIAMVKRRKLRLIILAPSQVKHYVTGYGRADKVAVSEAVAQRYPELSVYLRQNRQWQTRFHANMFDAVAIGLTALERL
jgi:crossover junction endodeoxyribonuclease RuvC